MTGTFSQNWASTWQQCSVGESDFDGVGRLQKDKVMITEGKFDELEDGYLLLTKAALLTVFLFCFCCSLVGYSDSVSKRFLCWFYREQPIMSQFLSFSVFRGVY